VPAGLSLIALGEKGSGRPSSRGLVSGAHRLWPPKRVPESNRVNLVFPTIGGDLIRNADSQPGLKLDRSFLPPPGIYR
jgi:hypothetical protein